MPEMRRGKKINKNFGLVENFFTYWFARSALFSMKTRVSLRYFVNDCRSYLQKIPLSSRVVFR